MYSEFASLHIQLECAKIRTRITLNTGTIHQVFFTALQTKKQLFLFFFPPNFNIPSQIEGSPLPCDFSFFYASLMFRIFFRCCFFLLDYRFYNSLLFFNFPIGIAILTEDIPTLLISFLRKAIF